MNVKGLVMKALKERPDGANAKPDDGVAIIFTVNNEVTVIKHKMTEDKFQGLCRHIPEAGKPKNINPMANIKGIPQ